MDHVCPDCDEEWTCDDTVCTGKEEEQCPDCASAAVEEE